MSDCDKHPLFKCPKYLPYDTFSVYAFTLLLMVGHLSPTAYQYCKLKSQYTVSKGHHPYAMEVYIFHSVYS